MLVRLYQAAAEPSVHETRLVAVRRRLSTLIGFGMLIYAATRMALANGETHDTMAAATIVLPLTATERSWGLLIRIAATKVDSGAGK